MSLFIVHFQLILLLFSNISVFLMGHLMIISLIVFIACNIVMDQPYMDEPFHVPQAQRYCKGDFEWDPKITTPPGLYYFSTLIGYFFGCSIKVLRSTNFALGLYKYYLLSKLTFDSKWLYFLPISFFYQNWYYTDTLSEVLMLQSYYGVVKQYRLQTFAFGVASVFIRQTNVVLLVWMVFWGVYERNKYTHPLLTTVIHNLSISDCLNTFKQFIIICFTNGLADISMLTGIITFLGLVVQKYGLLQGDSENHNLSFHFPQLLYFGTTLFGLFALYTNMHTVRYHYTYFITLWMFSYCMVHFFTIHHKFLLSDNRHLTFYFWKAFYRNLNLYKELFYSFVYSVVWYSLLDHLKHFAVIPVAGYLLSLALTLIPTPLFEFRYFIFHLTIFGIYFHKQTSYSKVTIIVMNEFVLLLFWMHPAHIMW
eukprot:NODE_254_length_12812_cov_0.286872.p5 type:complete len:423 gc:universal NODE_254_length_12812_cov_0.286872:3059-4327(+)